MNIGQIVTGKIKKIQKNYLIVLIKNNLIVKVYVSDISDYFIENLKTIFEINQKYEFLILNIKDKNKVKLSWKLINPLFMKNPFSYKIKETRKGFKKLIKNTTKKIND